MENKNINRASNRFGKYGKFLLYLVIVILVNIVFNLTPPGKLDLTGNNLFSISRASKQAVKTLQDPLTIRVFFTNNLSAPYNALKPYIKDILKEYGDHGNKRYFNYEFVDVGGGDEDGASERIRDNQNLASDYGIQSVNIQTYDDDKVSVRRAYMGIAFIHGDIVETLSPIQGTNGLEYRITSTIQKLNNKVSALLALEDKIKVKLFFSSPLKKYFEGQEQVTGLEEMVARVVEKASKQNFNKLELESRDPSVDSAGAAEAESLSAYAVGDASGQKLYADMFIVHGGKTERIPVIEFVRSPFGTIVNAPSEEDLEQILNDAITTLINTNEKIGYLLTGGTLPLADEESNPYLPPQQQQAPRKGITNFKGSVELEYSIDEVNLNEKGIPEGIKTLIIAGPEEKFSEYQLFQIDQFLMQGKSLALFLPGMKMEIPQANEQLYGQQMPPKFFPLRTGLENLLSHYGVIIEPSYVFDESSYETQDPQFGQFNFYQIPIIENDMVNSKVDYIRNILGMLVWDVSPLSVDEKALKDKNIIATRLFSSSPNSWLKEELPDSQSMPFITPPTLEEDKHSYSLSYILEGKFTSYFADKAIPEKPVKAVEEGEETPGAVADLDLKEGFISTGEPGKIFIIASKTVLDNQIFSQNLGQNVLFYTNILDYLNDRGEYAVMRTKLQTYNPLNKTEKWQRDFAKIFNIGVIPALVAVFGVMVLIQRKSRKEMLQAMFAKKTSKEE